MAIEGLFYGKFIYEKAESYRLLKIKTMKVSLLYFSISRDS